MKEWIWMSFILSRVPPWQDSMFIMIFQILHILNLLFGADNFMYTWVPLKWRCEQRLTNKLKWQMLGTWTQSVWRKGLRKSGQYHEAFSMLPFLIHFPSCSVFSNCLPFLFIFIVSFPVVLINDKWKAWA